MTHMHGWHAHGMNHMVMGGKGMRMPWGGARRMYACTCLNAHLMRQHLMMMR